MADMIKVQDLAKVQDIDFVQKFNGGIDKLLKVLGKFETIRMAPGTQLKVYKTSGTLESGTVAEGSTIPLSHYKNEVSSIDELTFNKWRKQTTMEAIAKRGYTQAVTKTDDEMIRDMHKGLRKTIYEFLATGTGVSSGANFQKTLANAWAKLEVTFEDDNATPIHFVNPLDIAEYLGNAQISLQTVFGMNYIENFLGIGSTFVDSHVPQGKVYSTAQENINIYSADCSSIEGFEFYSDQTGLIGVHHDTTYSNATLETVVASAVTLFPEYLDRIIVSSIEAVPEG